jgi:hypothetical protein
MAMNASLGLPKKKNEGKERRVIIRHIHKLEFPLIDLKLAMGIGRQLVDLLTNSLPWALLFRLACKVEK